MKIFLLSIVFSLSLTLFSQTKSETQSNPPNYKLIKKSFKKRVYKKFYSELMDRYQQADSSLTLLDKRYIYYGFPFQKKYNPNYAIGFSDSLKILLVKANNPNADLKDENLLIIRKISDSTLKYDPLNILALKSKLFADNKLGYFNQAKKIYFQLKSILEAILSSGDGITQASAIYVTDPSDQIEVLKILHYDYANKIQSKGNYNFLVVKDNPKKLQGLYFENGPKTLDLKK